MLIIIKQKRELAKYKSQLAQHQENSVIAKLRAKDKAMAKDTSKCSAKAGKNESDSSDNPSNRNKLYRAPGNRNKQLVSTFGHVSSTKSSRKGGSPAKKDQSGQFPL